MPIAFRPRLEALDGRDMPSVTPFTFALSNGTLVSGSFDYANAAVDPALASQQVPVSDLTVALDGQAATLPVQLTAPTATFALGQFQGLSLSAVAVANGVVTIIDTAGALAPISMPVLAVNPINPPIPLIGPINWSPIIEAYNQNVDVLGRYTAGPNILDGRSGILQTLMARHDYWTNRRDEAVILASGATNPLWQAAYSAYVDFALAQLRGVELELLGAYIEYQAKYLEVVIQYWQLFQILPPDQRATLAEPPEAVYIPDEYFDYIRNLIC